MTVSNTTAVTKGQEGTIGTFDIVHKQTNEGVEVEGVGGNLGPLTASYGFDGSFSLGGSINDEESGIEIHGGIGAGAMNGDGVFTAGLTSKGPNGISTSTDVSLTPGLKSAGLAVVAVGLAVTAPAEVTISIPTIVKKLMPAK